MPLTDEQKQAYEEATKKAEDELRDLLSNDASGKGVVTWFASHYQQCTYKRLGLVLKKIASEIEAENDR